ncbi:hypothetical protein GPECTOR_11g118 [Gonium pectorale]|uniref:Uncharacterized protein n=1 Tax=Gonium pectorale TaxID=33097 RepID=A0A150GPE2_GONPE|nr:hypothetical protein GPECTOR_11g118 [Gonium pectorale]|eukprot:KXZ51665.1 hypothetical protein GPECTOR_11g118 [Gonium pectorale]
MVKHRLPAVANRLRVSRGFDAAWFTGPAQYAKMLQRDWLLTKNAWSFVQRSSRSAPRSNKDDPALLAQQSADPSRPRYPKKPTPQTQDARDFPNFRPARVFTQHLPFKSLVSVFAYSPPKDSKHPQSKYGLFQSDRKLPQSGPPGGTGGAGASAGGFGGER